MTEPAPTTVPDEAREPLILPPDEFEAVKAVAAVLAGCPSPCDPDCEADCHETHNPVHMRWHDPGWSCGEVQRAIAEAVAAEREALTLARLSRSVKLARIVALCRGVDECPDCGRGEALVKVADILAIIGTEEEAHHGV